MGVGGMRRKGVMRREEEGREGRGGIGGEDAEGRRGGEGGGRGGGAWGGTVQREARSRGESGGIV